ncbi:MAG: DNA ligase D, partial [Burkholderiaceae bacterium]
IKERDDVARPSSEFDITEALPDSVNTTPDRRTSRDTERVASASSTSLPSGARASKLPLTLSPQLATLTTSAPKSGDWIYEIKFDGYRVLARVDGSDVRLLTRNGHDWTSRLKHLAQAVAALALPSGWLDGEIVIPLDAGRTSFQSLQNAFETSSMQDIHYYLFDVPYFDGHDLRQVPLRERRELLQRMLAANKSDHLRFSEEFASDERRAAPSASRAPAGGGRAATGGERIWDAGSLLDAACKLKLEGVIGKRADSSYTSARSNTWIKLKCTQRQEFVIGGYTDPKGSRTGIGSLLLGVHDQQGRLIYAGNVGTGFSEKTLAQLKSQLTALQTAQSPFHDLPRGIKGHWVKPKLVAEVSFGEWTNDGRIRHSVFHGLRTDKAPGTITKEAIVAPATDESSVNKMAKSSAKKATAEKATAKKAVAKSGAPANTATTIAGVKVSNAGRVIDTSTGLTKLDLVRYYESISSHILP